MLDRTTTGHDFDMADTPKPGERNVAPRSETVEQIDRDTPSRLGVWFWVSGDDDTRWLGCCVREGSNYLKIAGPGQYGTQSSRIHLDEIDECLTEEPNAPTVIAGFVERYRAVSARLMAEVGEIVRRLGIDAPQLSGRVVEASSTALSVPQGKGQAKRYENALVKAQTKTLPEKFKQIATANELMAKWMSAAMLPLQGQLDEAQSLIGAIEKRVDAIKIYAGLTEEVVRCSEGTAAGSDEKLRLMQRRLYMDEECLANYRNGGMDFSDIKDFDGWISLPENRDRIMPFPKCVVSMRVRRTTMERDWQSLLDLFINLRMEQLDKSTFLYIRNGENVWRLSCAIDFGDKLFPDRATFDPQRPMMAKMFGSRVSELFDRAHYESLLAEHRAQEAAAEKWNADNPDETWDEEAHGPKWMNNPHRHSYFHEHEWQPFEPSSVYYDDISEEVADTIAQYNRVALIIQGLFDRSDVFKPHAPVKTWSSEAFARAIDLIYDGSDILLNGEAPDFESYRARVNAKLCAGCVTVGQDDYWMSREAAKYNAQASRSPYARNHRPVKRHRPYGNPGPGFVSTVDQWSRSKREATYSWRRQRQRESGTIDTSVNVPSQHLLNVSAYVPGDFKRFFADPRTRAEYLQWAPYLLAAEEWHAGRRDFKERRD